MGLPVIEVAVAGGVATLTLSRPDKLNAFTRPMLLQLAAELDRAAADEAISVAVLTGAGRAFCTGQDLAEIAAADVSRVLDELYAPLVERLMSTRLVTIAALNGPAVGAGASVALSCDFVVAAECASLAVAFVRIGLIPDAGATWLLPRAAGLRNAMALALTGDSITAREAQGMGLVYRVFADDVFGVEMTALARRIAAYSSAALRLNKQVLRASLENGLAAQMALEAKLQGEAAATPEFRKAVAAFLARRK